MPEMMFDVSEYHDVEIYCILCKMYNKIQIFKIKMQKYYKTQIVCIFTRKTYIRVAKDICAYIYVYVHSYFVLIFILHYNIIILNIIL